METETKNVDCLAFTGITDCECAGTPQWSSGSGGRIERWCESGRCPVLRGGKCRRDKPEKLKKVIKHKTLISFLKNMCVNYYNNNCLLSNFCEVIEGRRCGYFEKRVLGSTDYKYRLPGYDYSKIFGEYIERTGAKIGGKVETRNCTCGKPLGYRQKLCDTCKKKNRKKTSRIYQKEYYRKNRSRELVSV